MSLLLLLLLPASAHASPWRAADWTGTFEDGVDAFDAVERDTGVWPRGSALGVRFFIASQGRTRTELPVRSALAWPEPLSQALSGGRGFHDVDVEIELAAVVSFDLWGIRGSYDVWSHTFDIAGEVKTDGLLLPGSAQPVARVSTTGDAVAHYETEVDLGSGFYLLFDVDGIPQLTSTLTGQQIEVGDQVLVADGQTLTHDIPLGRAKLSESATWSGRLHSELDLELRPAISICEDWLGCFEVSRFSLPVEIVDSTEDRRFKRQQIVHNLPALDVPAVFVDFGEVQVQDVEVRDLVLRSVGDAEIEVQVAVGGDDAFDVDTTSLVVPGDSEDRLEVRFAPEFDGPFEATLTLFSNDPGRPEVLVQVQGTGVPLPPDPDTGDPDDTDEPDAGGTDPGDGGVPHLAGCACGGRGSDEPPVLGSAPLLLLGLGGMARRRRR